MFKKVMSLVLSLSLVLSFAVFSGAVSSEQYRIVEENGDTVYQYDGFKIRISDAPTVQSRASVIEDKTGVATTKSPATYDLAFTGNKYTYASITIYNDDDSASLIYNIEGIVNDLEFSMGTTIVKAGSNAFVTIEADEGRTLSGGVETTIKPHSASSVAYQYISRKS